MRNFVFANVNDVDDAKVARSLTLHREMIAPMAWKKEAGRSLDHLVRGWLGLKASETKGVPKLKPKLMTAATKAVNEKLFLTAKHRKAVTVLSLSLSERFENPAAVKVEVCR